MTLNTHAPDTHLWYLIFPKHHITAADASGYMVTFYAKFI